MIEVLEGLSIKDGDGAWKMGAATAVMLESPPQVDPTKATERMPGLKSFENGLSPSLPNSGTWSRLGRHVNVYR